MLALHGFLSIVIGLYKRVTVYFEGLTKDRLKSYCCSEETLTQRLENQRQSIKDLHIERDTLKFKLLESEKNREHKSKRINEVMDTNHNLIIRCGELKSNFDYAYSTVKDLQLENVQLIAKCVKLDEQNKKQNAYIDILENPVVKTLKPKKRKS